MPQTVATSLPRSVPRREVRTPDALPFSVEAVHDGSLSLPPNCYELIGSADLPVVVVLGGISAHRHAFSHPENPVPGWWDEFVGDAQAIDSRCYRILSIDYAWRESGPVDTRDQARLIVAILDRCHISRIHAIVGASYGGMIGLAFASLFPNRLDRLIAISAAHESHPMATAVRVIQRRIIRLARSAGKPQEGVALARALGVTTYRTADEFAERFVGDAELGAEGYRFPVEAYLDHNGERFAATFSDSKYLSLSESLDLHQVDPRSITVPVTLIAVDRDTLVPAWQMRELFAWLSGPGRFVEISSRFGHDAFLKEVDAISEVILRALGGQHVA